MIKYGLSHADYLRDSAIGSSQAKLCLDSMQKFQDSRTGLIQNRSSPAKSFGTAAHLRFLQPSLLADQLSSGPINEKTGNPYGSDTLKYQSWAEENPNKIVLSRSDLADLEYMDQRMPDPVKRILDDADADAEVSVFQTIDGVAVKCRPDQINMELGIITDLKTIDDIGSVRYAMRSWAYWFQQEWYKRVLLAETGRKFQFRFVFAERHPPYRWKIVTTSEETCEEGAAVVRGVLIMLREAMRNGEWRDTGNIYEEITWPDCGHFEEDAP